MSAESNKALVRRFFDEVCNGLKLEVADTLFARDHVYHDPIIKAEPGPEGVKRVVAPYHPAFSDVRWKIDDMVAGERGIVVTRWTGTGTHTDEVMGIIDDIASRLDPADVEAARADVLTIFGLMIGTLQLARALTERELSDQLLARGVETALTLLDEVGG